MCVAGPGLIDSDADTITSNHTRVRASRSSGPPSPNPPTQGHDIQKGDVTTLIAKACVRFAEPESNRRQLARSETQTRT